MPKSEPSCIASEPFHSEQGPLPSAEAAVLSMEVLITMARNPLAMYVKLEHAYICYRTFLQTFRFNTRPRVGVPVQRRFREVASELDEGVEQAMLKCADRPS